MSGRNNRLTEIAGILRAEGRDEDEIREALLNHEDRDGLPEREVYAIARSIGNKPAGEPRRNGNGHYGNGRRDLRAAHRHIANGSPRAEKTEQRREDRKAWHWKTEAEARAGYERLSRADESPEVVELLATDYGIRHESIPPEWRIIDHPRLGLGIVYPGIAASESTVFKFKAIARNQEGKRACLYLHGGGGAMVLRADDALALWVIAGGEEKAVAAHASGFNVFSPLAGEGGFNEELAAQFLALNPSRVIVANDADDAGAKANQKAAEAIEKAGFPFDQIAVVDWPKGAAEGHDLSDVLKSEGAPGIVALVAEAKPYEPRVKPLGLWSLDQLFAYELPADDFILGDGVITAGELTLVAGPPDAGKSRVAVQLVSDLLLGHSDWLGALPIHRHDLRIAIIQTENNIRRLRADFGAQLRGCTPEQRQSAQERLRFHVPMTPADRDLGLDDPANIERLIKTVKHTKPDLLLLDPWGDLFGGDNENDAVQTRASIKVLMAIVQAHSPRTACVLIHHARSGKTAAAGADGWERQAYARGSKALMSIARAQINIAPGDGDGAALIVACGKNNNGPKFPAFAIRLNQETLRYERDGDFDLESWREEVNGPGGSRGPKKKVTVEIVRMALRELGGSAKKGALAKAIQTAADCSSSTAYDAIKVAAEKDAVFEGAGLVSLPMKDRSG